ncbi:MAG: hypothetical protein K0R21_2085, partial [Anaerocolumna sp.]|nr:hypothetical protein [Anaerocolumna sp.]
IFYILIGLFIIIHTLLKPKYFWEHRKAKALRNRFGDTPTTILYLIIGGLLFLLGILLGILTVLNINEFLGMPIR